MTPAHPSTSSFGASVPGTVLGMGDEATSRKGMALLSSMKRLGEIFLSLCPNALAREKKMAERQPLPWPQ